MKASDANDKEGEEMIWYRKPEPNIGDTKIIRKFLLFPRITDEHVAWLGFYKLTYELKEIVVFDSEGPFTKIVWDLVSIKE